jgi:hypothetical protein
LPAMMRMVVTTPNILKGRRPEWLNPFNFFLFPLLSEAQSYPVGFDKSNFFFITPMETDRRKWRSLEGINVFDEQTYQIAMSHTGQPDRVIPDSLKIILNKYLKKPETKSLAPDGSPCVATTRGLLRRTKIVAGQLIPVGKETDRRWEHGEEPSMLEPKSGLYEKQRKMCVADPSERKAWRAMGVRRLIKESGLSQTTVYKILTGNPVRRQILLDFRQQIGRITN